MSIEMNYSQNDEIIDSFFEEIENSLSKFKNEVSDTRIKSNNDKREIIRNYKKKLKEYLNVIEQKPISSIDLSKPTEEFDDLNEKSKEMNKKCNDDINDIIHECKFELIDFIRKFSLKDEDSKDTEDTSFPVHIPTSNSNNNIFYYIKYDKYTAEPIQFYISSYKNNCLNTNYIILNKSDFENKTRRPNISIRLNNKSFYLWSENNRTTCNIGQNSSLDKLWFDLVDYYNPYT